MLEVALLKTWFLWFCNPLPSYSFSPFAIEPVHHSILITNISNNPYQISHSTGKNNCAQLNEVNTVHLNETYLQIGSHAHSN